MKLWQTLKELWGELHDADTARLEDLQEIIGYHFRDVRTLQLGLTHRSYSRSNGQIIPSNERLEFLGDSVLGLVIAARLYDDYPDEGEGNLTKTKALLVNETTLAGIGRKLRINVYIRLSPEEERAGGRERPSIISDAFESIIGAVFLDGGLEPARDVVLRLIYTHKDHVVADSSQRNYKGELLELIQSRGNGAPRYDVVSEVGPDHDKVFHVVVTIGGEEAGKGSGSSKKEAEQRAACQALEYLEGRPS
ncbi:MAG: ribonuclease III [Candidatus Zixiibacteriota bacterium]